MTLVHILTENKAPSISLLCQLAGVNRANLYATHPDIVAEIRNLKQKQCPGRTAPKSRRTGSTEVKETKKLIDALAYTCLELRHALDEERSRSDRAAQEILGLKRELLQLRKKI